MVKTVFITGVNSGFGLLTTKTLLKNGHTVIGTMRDIDGRNSDSAGILQSFAENHSGELHLVELDVADESSVKTAFDEVKELTPTVDVLVNNAGIGTGGLTEGFTTEQFSHVFNVNVMGVHRLTRAFLPGFRQQGYGQIINVSSVMGRIVIPFATAYTATKFALEGYSESLRYELNELGINVSIVEPGGFLTGFLDRMVPPEDEQALAGYGDYAEVPEQMWSGFEEQLSGEEAPDPQAVADAITDLIETDDKPPLRVVVDPMTGGEGPKAVNSTSADVQKQLFDGFGMSDMLK